MSKEIGPPSERKSKANNDWTPERIEQLKELWDAGLSAGLIAAEMGLVTRNAIIGKARRLKLPYRVDPEKRRPGFRRKRPSGWARWRDKYGIAAVEPKNAGAVLSAVKAAQTKARKAMRKLAWRRLSTGNVKVKGISIWKLDHTTCRWPLWSDDDTPLSGKKFCGHKVEPDGCSYCSAHASLAFGEPRERKSRQSSFKDRVWMYAA